MYRFLKQIAFKMFIGHFSSITFGHSLVNFSHFRYYLFKQNRQVPRKLVQTSSFPHKSGTLLCQRKTKRIFRDSKNGKVLYSIKKSCRTFNMEIEKYATCIFYFDKMKQDPFFNRITSKVEF